MHILWTIIIGFVAGVIAKLDFALVSDQATKFVAKHWLEISALAGASMAA